MGNCISKISKDRFFAIEELMKNDILFSNGRVRFDLDMLTGGTYMRLHSIKKIPEQITLAPLQTGAWRRDHFKKGGSTSIKMKRNPCQG